MMSNELKNLNGMELTLIELDNKMEALGFDSIFDEVDESTLKMNGSASYQVNENDFINIEFEVINDDENIVKITNIEEL